MNEELKAFYQHCSTRLWKDWSLAEKSSELAQNAIEVGFGNLPELSIDGSEGVNQKEYDYAVEEAFTFLKGEALAYLNATSKLG